MPHVAPSVDDNNRYIKLTPEGDRVRLSYTIFFGDVPAAGLRPTIDASHDGVISDAEGAVFGKKIAGEITASIDVALDGTTVPIVWESVAVGMASPQVAAGSFSVDLVASLCLSGRGTHAVLMRDRFKLTRPGETEIRVEDAPGVTIDHARVGATDDPTHDYRFAGPAAPLADDGFDVAFTAGEHAPLTGCKNPGGKPAPGATLAIVIALVAAVGGAGAFIYLRRRATLRRP